MLPFDPLWLRHWREDRLLPKIFLDDKSFNDLCYPWGDSLIIKLLGKNIGYTQMNSRLSALWKLNGGFDLMDVGHGFFMAKFDQENDRQKVMDGDPWIIFDQILCLLQLKLIEL